MEHGFYHPDRGYWQTTDAPNQKTLGNYPEGTIEVPLKPIGPHELINGAWVYVAPDTAQLRASWRDQASLTKTQFVLACVSAGILTSSEAVAVGRGDWPSAMANFLTYLSEEQAIEVQIEWAAQVNIRRTNVFVLLLGSWLQYSDAQLDALFGWTE